LTLQTLNPFFHSVISQRRKLVEQRRNPRRIYRQHQDVEGHPGQPGVKPPPLAHALHQPQHGGDQRQAERGAQHQALDEIDPEQFDGDFVESVTLLDDEGAVQAQRNVDDHRYHGDTRDQRQAAHDAGLEPGRGQFVQGLQAAAEGEGQRYRRLDHHPEHRETGLCPGVIRSALVCVQRDDVGKLRRHGIAVGQYVGGVA